MAFEHQLTPPWSRPANSTGMRPRRFVTVNTSEYAQYPANGAAAAGVSVTGSTGSTKDQQPIGILSFGVARVEALTGALKAGAQCKATSVGYASSLSAGDYAVGLVVAGSTGGTGRVLSVLVYPIGTT